LVRRFSSRQATESTVAPSGTSSQSSFGSVVEVVDVPRDVDVVELVDDDVLLVVEELLVVLTDVVVELDDVVVIVTTQLVDVVTVADVDDVDVEEVDVEEDELDVEDVLVDVVVVEVVDDTDVVVVVVDSGTSHAPGPPVQPMSLRAPPRDGGEQTSLNSVAGFPLSIAGEPRTGTSAGPSQPTAAKTGLVLMFSSPANPPCTSE
jgi:hypothetical protein